MTKTLQIMTFTNMSREELEDELRRCNEIMGTDGKQIGELTQSQTDTATISMLANALRKAVNLLEENQTDVEFVGQYRALFAATLDRVKEVK